MSRGPQALGACRAAVGQAVVGAGVHVFFAAGARVLFAAGARVLFAAGAGALLAAGAGVLLAVSTGAQAGEATAPPGVASPVSLLSLLQVLLALLIVLAAIGAFAWLMRRFGPGQGSAGGLLRVVGGVMVGPKERLVVVEVGETWLLLGVAGSSVTLVHSMPKPPQAAPAAQPGPGGAFQRLLGQALGRARPGP